MHGTKRSIALQREREYSKKGMKNVQRIKEKKKRDVFLFSQKEREREVKRKQTEKPNGHLNANNNARECKGDLQFT